MKSMLIIRYFITITILLIVGSIYSLTIAQTQWYKYPGNVAYLGEENEWQRKRSRKAIIFENGYYKMWYSSFNKNNVNILGYAASTDGITWEGSEGNSITFECVDESWDSGFDYFDIIKTDTAYFMWYTFKVNENNVTCLGFAWSKDGMDWIKYPEQVLKHGDDDKWDARGPRSVSVIFDGYHFRMFYSSYDKSRPAVERLGMAISTDGIHWDKNPANPVFEEGEPGSWDDQGVGLCNVVFDGSKYDLWYSGNNLIRTQIGHASSVNGIQWERLVEDPVIRNGKLGERDSRNIHSPEVVLQDSVYRMWYFGYDNYMGFYAYATTSVNELADWEAAGIIKPHRKIRVNVYGRTEYVKVDSLTEMLSELYGRDLIDAYNWLAIAYSLNDEAKSLDFADKAIELAGKASYPEARAMAFYIKGNRELMMDNYGIALTNYLSSLHIYDSLNMLYEKGDLLLCVAELNSHVGSMDLRCSYARQALEVYEQMNDTGSIIYSLNYLGYVSLGNGDTAMAIKAFKRKLDLDGQKRNFWALADNYCSLGLCYSGRMLDSALLYFNKAIVIRDSLWSDPGARTYNIIAKAYFAAGPEYYKEAENYYLKSYDRYWAGSYPKEVEFLYEIAELYLSTGRYNKCREFLGISLKLCQLWLSRLEHQLFHNTGKIYNEWLLKSNLEKIHRLWFRLDTTLNDEESALKHFMLATQYKDSIYNDQKRKQWAMLQGQYETEKAQDQIAVLEMDNEVKNLTLKKTRSYLIGLGILVLIIILGATIFIRNRKIRAQYALELERVKSEKLQELDSLKSRFFANISHEFRTPLTLILGPLEKLLIKTTDHYDIKELGIAKKYARKLQVLINNLLTISKLESGKLQLFASEIDIVKLIRSYLQAFESLAKQKNIELQFISENKEIKAFIDQEKFEQVLNNLLSNAFKFSEEGGRIEVNITPFIKDCHFEASSDGEKSLGNLPLQLADSSPAIAEFGMTGEKEWKENKKCIEIKISDSGHGISPEHIDHIFDRFYQVENEDNSYYEGTGIGLALTKELVELHYGIIKVHSEQGQGSTFTVLLPLGKDHLKPEEIGVEKTEEIISSIFVQTEIDNNVKKISLQEGIQENKNNSPILLIVEDNIDMRSYIRGYFEKKFHIIEAINGADGYEKSIEHIPDIVISDVMMPKMDGNEFCRKVKTDERTSHIPVILLTARASKESRIEGLEIGADDFITKPFDGEELQVRVKNIIEQRKRIRNFLEEKIQKSNSTFQIDFEDSGITSMDERFLQKVIEIVKEHYSDPEFNTKEFGQAIGLGRIQLNRKIKALTGQTTVSFIRAFRLNSAAELIKKKSATIAEIAYDVGFNNPSYFTECFRAYFGKLPSEFNEED